MSESNKVDVGATLVVALLTHSSRLGARESVWARQQGDHKGRPYINFIQFCHALYVISNKQ